VFFDRNFFNLTPYYLIANAINPRMISNERMLRILFSNRVTCSGISAGLDP